jgi:ABC-2 type transport system permease protein
LDWGGLAAAYLGNFMLAAAFLALGLFCSALFDNQVLAAGLGLTVGLFLLLIGWIVGPEFEQPGMARQLLEFILPVTHYRNFLSGVADTRDLAYFVGFGGFLLFLTVKVVESRKWR